MGAAGAASSEGFERSARTRVLFGPGRLAELGGLVRDLGVRRVLVVSDPGIVAAGIVARAEASLEAAGLAWRTFSEVRENPTTEDVDRCLRVARAFEPELFLGLGGGSSIDVAKGTDFLLTNGGRLQDYWGVDRARVDLLPIVAVPTTAGTGTDVQRFALVADAETKQKMACGHPSAAPLLSLLDPELTGTVPPFVTACTGLDAVAHAVETLVTRPRNELSDGFARAALRLAARGLPRVLADAGDLEARGQMLRAASLAGLAIENSMLGAAHALANPLTARFDVPHGQAVGTVLPVVVRFNGEDAAVAALYAAAAREMGLAEAVEDDARATAALATWLEGLLERAGLPGDLDGLGVEVRHAPALAEEAARQWTGGFNPRPLDATVLEALYRRAARPSSRKG